MSATGALTTKMYASPVRPTTRTQVGYEALGTRTIDPTLIADFTGFINAAAAVAGDTSLSLDQSAAFTVAADAYVGSVFTIAGDATEYTVISHEAKATSNTDAVTFNISPPLAADAADNAVLTSVSQISALLLTQADFDAVFSGDTVQISAALAPLVTGRDYHVIKSAIVRKIWLAASPEQARAGTFVVITGTLGTQTLSGSNWHLLGELTNIGQFGRSYETVTANNLARGATRKAKGSYNNGSVSFEALYDSRDPGAQVMEEGLVDTANYAFWVDIPPDGDGNDGENIYFQALIMSFMPRVGGANDMVMSTGSLEIDHNDPVRVAA